LYIVAIVMETCSHPLLSRFILWAHYWVTGGRDDAHVC